MARWALRCRNDERDEQDTEQEAGKHGVVLIGRATDGSSRQRAVNARAPSRAPSRSPLGPGVLTARVRASPHNAAASHALYCDSLSRGTLTGTIVVWVETASTTSDCSASFSSR
ncbi:MAG: hypothetical protein QOD83_3133 [Solirubrobacteraceae bacterium]|nr:hypothetical protein [Solirubrobacteraceae bacterium]